MYEVTIKPGGAAYAEILRGEGHGRGQMLLNGASFAALRDPDGVLPPGLRVAADGTAVASDLTPVRAVTFTALTPPKDGSDFYAGVLLSGPISKAAIQDNIARPLTAAEINQFPNRIILD